MQAKKTKGSGYRTDVTRDANSLITEDTIDSYSPRVRNYIGLKQKYSLDSPMTVKQTETHQEEVNEATLYTLVKIASESQMVERHTATQVHCLESLETCLASFLNYVDVLGTGFQEDPAFINTYALFRGAVLARDHLRTNCPVKFLDTPKKTALDLKNNQKEIVYDMVHRLFKRVEQAYHSRKAQAYAKDKGLTDEMLVHVFDIFYTHLINQCISAEPVYKELLEKTGLDAPHEVKGVIFTGFKARDSKQEKLALKHVTLDMVVGNEEFIEKGKTLVENVLAYSFDAPDGGKNPMGDFPQLIMSFGEPGGGKTLTAYALLNYFTKLAKENGIPFLTKVIRKSDWTSSYQYASAQNLVNVFNEVFNYDGVAGIYWPDFDTAFQARDSPDIRAEEKDNLNVIFGLLDGTIGPRNGKWFIILDANYMDPKNMDKATFSRLMEENAEVKGPEKPEHYTKLCKDILLKDQKKFLTLKKEAWEEFGKKCHGYKLSGRAIEKISKRTAAHISKFEKPEGFLKMSYEEKLKVTEERSRKVDSKWLMSTLENYVKFQKKRDEREAFEKAEKELKDLVSQLSKKPE